MTIPDLLFARPWALALLVLIPPLLMLGRGLRSAPIRARISIALRGAVLLLLIVGLAGPLTAENSTRVTTVFVIDRSLSVQQAAADAANQWIADALEQGGSDRSAAIVTFSSQPNLVVPASTATTIGRGWMEDVAADTVIDATDLESALTLARALPVGEGRRIVLLSDGAENIGSALEAADAAALEGIPIDVVPLTGIETSDLRISRLSGPAAIWQGDDLGLLANIGSGGGGEATIELLVDGVVVSTDTVQLTPGETAYSFAVPGLAGGFHRLEVRVGGSETIDRVAENNVAYAGVHVREQPGVLLVTPVGAESSRLQQALVASGANVEVRTPADLPVRLGDFASWDSIVLNNVSAWEMSSDQQAALVAHTRAGNGMIVVGGSAAFGPGSYAGTSLESALPVTVRVVDGQQRPSVAVLIVMDKSGSMSYDPADGGASKIELAKDGVVTAASALVSGDQIGVVAFNDEPIWALPMTTLTGQGDLARVQEAIAPLSADGGTEMYPALQVAYDQLRNVDADVRHIILLSDGKSRSGSDEAYANLVSNIGNDDITLSTVALGTDADLELLQSIADEGNGRYHVANAPEEIPQITFEEAQSAGSQSVLRGSFTPIQTQASPILNGIDVTSMPAVEGYNFAASRPDAQVDLTSDRGDPLLSKWQLGLGRVVAWTADDGSDYAGAWDAWPQYDQFWGAALRWTLPDPTNTAVSIDIEQTGDAAIVTVDSLAGSGEAIDLSAGSATVRLADGSTVSSPLVPAAPGEYDVLLPEPVPGAVEVVVSDGGADARTWAAAGAIQGSLEWFPRVDGHALLTALAERTGGRIISLDSQPDVSLFSAAGGAAEGPGTVRPIWMWPVAAALALFVADIALRIAPASRRIASPSRRSS